MKIYSPIIIGGASGVLTTVPLGADIQSYINSSSPGDVLVFSPGIYEIDTTLTIDKNLTLAGNSMSDTSIVTSGSTYAEPLIDYVDGANIVAINSIKLDGSDRTTKIIRNSTRTYNPPTHPKMYLTMENVNIVGTDINGELTTSSYGLYLKNTELTLRNVYIDLSARLSTDAVTDYGIYLFNDTYCGTYANIYDSNIDVSSAGNSAGFYYAANGDVRMNMYGSHIHSQGGIFSGLENSVACWSNCASNVTNIYGSRMGCGVITVTKYDIKNESGTFSIYGCILDRNLVSGSVNQNGSFYGDGLNMTSSTGGTGSAGSGKQYVSLKINGVEYKLLHDGTV